MNEVFLYEYHQQFANISLPERIKKHYTIIKCLKSGEEKQTYLVESKDDHCKAVLKWAPLSCEEHLASEYNVLLLQNHMSIPKAIDYFEENGFGYLLREYYKGISLYDKVQHNGTLREMDAVRALLGVCPVMEYLHKQNPPVIHRDIKPQNIIYTEDGEYKLIDMGTCRLFKESVEQDTVFMGTQATAAPEQYGYCQTNERSDIYAMGILLLYLLTGSFSLERWNTDTISAQIRRIILKCVAFAPQNRYPSVKALKTKLLRHLHRKRVFLRRAVISAAVLLVLAAGSVAIVMRSGSMPMKFESPLIQKAVQLELGKRSNEPVLQSEMAELKNLLICGDTPFTDITKHYQYYMRHAIEWKDVKGRGDISSLKDLRNCKKLQQLILDNQNIKDLSDISGLPLVKVSLCGNQIYNLAPLAKCEQLTELRLEENPINNVDDLKNLKKLEYIDLGVTQINDISALSGLPIQELYLVNQPIKDFSPLTTMYNLKRLYVGGVSYEEQKYISGLTGLRNLTIYGSGISSIKSFTSLTNLTFLDLYGNNLSDIRGIIALKGLTSVCIGNNPIKSIAPLKELPNLCSINISKAEITDLELLSEFPALQEVLCDEKQAEAIKKEIPNATFRIKVC